MRSPPFFRPFSRPGAWSLATCRRTSSSKAAWKNHGNLGRKSWEHIQKWWENDGNMGKWWENLMGRSELLGISEEKKSWFLWTSKFTLKTSTEFSGCRKIGCLLVYQFIIVPIEIAVVHPSIFGANPYVPWLKHGICDMEISSLGIPDHGFTNPYHWIDDHHPQYGKTTHALMKPEDCHLAGYISILPRYIPLYSDKMVASPLISPNGLYLHISQV